MALAIKTICTNIAAISVNGVTLKDYDEIPIEVIDRDCPVFFPEPINYVTDLSVVRDAFGSAAQSKKTAQYTLNYTFCHHKIGSERNSLEQYDNMVDKAFAILDAIIAPDDLGGTVQFEPQDVEGFGVVLDPAGSAFNGCRIQVRITEFIN